MYVDLALPLPIKKLFTYKVPKSLRGSIGLGQRVLVQLGTRFMVGVVVMLDVPAPQVKTKDILFTLEPYAWFSKNMLDLTKWMSEYYSSSWGECLRVASPQYSNISDKIWIEVMPPEMETEDLSPKRKEIWEIVKGKHRIRLNRLVQNLETENIHQHLEYLQQQGLVSLKLKLPRAIQKGPALFPMANIKSDLSEIGGLNLDDDQKRIVDLISQDIEKKIYSTFLLLGKDKSKRRAVQLELVKKVIQAQKQVLVLLPEVCLLNEVVSGWPEGLRQKAAILHPRISINQKISIWEKIRNREFPLVFGTRSAVFAPLDDLELIVVEEENHPLHKEEASPYYNARDVAVKRGKLEKAVVILPCGFPSLESFHNCQIGKYKLCEIKDQTQKESSLKIEIIDKKKKGGAKTVISSLILDILKKETEPAVLLLNRRGFSKLVVCEDCGFVFRCPDCGISLTLHKTNFVLQCHYCSYKEKETKVCPQCGGTNFSYRRLGTQNLEQVLRENMPQIRSARLDRDVSDKPDSAKQILSEFYKGKYQVLLGTQMILQRLDLSKVGLVVILSVDELLVYPDFRARERTFHFLSQIINRMVEANPQAKLILQTSRPEDWVIRYGIKGDFTSFYQREIEQRKELFYPPFSHLISIWFSGKNKEGVMKFSTSLVDSLSNLIVQEKISKTQILGPSPIFYAKRKKQNQWQAIVKTTSPVKINSLVDYILEQGQLWKNKSVKLKVEVDPLSLV